MAVIRVQKVVYEHRELKLSTDSHMTLGNQLDAYVETALENGEIVQEVAFVCEPDEWTHWQRELHDKRASRKAASRAV